MIGLYLDGSPGEFGYWAVDLETQQMVGVQDSLPALLSDGWREGEWCWKKPFEVMKEDDDTFLLPWEFVA